MLDVVDNIESAYIKESEIHGFGLFSSCNIEANNKIVDLDGQIVPWFLHEKLGLTEEWNALPGDRVLVRPYKTKYYYINHSRSPNLKIVRDGCDKVFLYTKVDIFEGQELLLDYREEPLAESYLRGHGATYL